MKWPLVNSLIVLTTTLLVVAAFVGGWILLDKFLNPAYVPYGTRTLYQEAARTEIMEQPVAYIGAERCNGCHFSVEQEWLHSAHGTVACENCHGPRSTHVENGVSTPVNTTADLCLTCHARLASRPDAFPQVHPEDHSNGLACLQCHDPMHPDVSRPPQVTHTLSEGMDCLACHRSQGLRPMPVGHEQHSVESCLQCHIEEEQR